MRDLVRGDDPGAEDVSGVEILALGGAELARHLPHLGVAGGDVVEDRVAEDVAGRVGRLDVLAGLADDDGELELDVDMYVREYLRFVAGLNAIRKPDNRIDELIGQTGLEREQFKKIGALSKGYRQRVGLSQAMLHDPEVLILDEPTAGLDPNQLEEIRQLIKDLGKEKTVIFSTHIMQEVQLLCDRVLIIDRGQLVANDPIEELQARLAGEVLITLGFSETQDAGYLKKIPGVQSIRSLGPKRWQLTAESGSDIRPDIFRAVVEQGHVLVEFHQESASVENVFQRLTRRTAVS